MSVYLKAVQSYDLEQVTSAIEEGIKQSGVSIHKADTAVIKTNIVQARTPESGVIVHPVVAEAIIDILADYGVRHIMIAEAPAIGVDTQKAFKVSGYADLARRKGVRLIDLFDVPRTKVHIGYGYQNLPNVYNEIDLPKYQCDYIRVPNLMLEADIYVNLAKLKTHNRTIVSLTMKNQWGLLSFKDRQMYHRVGLHEPTVQLARAVKPHLTVIDGILGLEGNGPVLGEPKWSGALIVGSNMTETDIVGSMLMKQDPYDVIHIKRAVDLGLGRWEVDVKGARVEELASEYEPAPQNVIKNHNLYLWRNHRACHLDEDAFANAVNLAKRTPKYWPFILKLAYYTFFKRIDLVRGRGNRMPEIKQGQRIIVSGDCAFDLLENYEEVPKNIIHIPGCPPDPEDIIKAVLKM
jgi:uncharacterized protein (DUF362 family)